MTADAMAKLMWHSNSPWSSTGYGAQTALFTPLLADYYDVTISSFWGLEGSPIRWNDIPVLPGLGGDFGNATLPAHAQRVFGGDPRGGMVVTLCDVWVLDPEMARGLNMACWTPVDHDPVPPKVLEFFAESEAVPIAMSRFGERQLARLDPLYVPHAAPCDIFKPLNREQARGSSFPKDAFITGMVAANKGHPSRKSFSQALLAWRRFAESHDNAFLYLHTVLDPNHGQGVNLPALIRDLGIPSDRIRIADQYAMMYAPYPLADMAKIYNALDVLLNPSFGEGFGIGVLEAAACGVPAVVTDWTAMPEVCGAGWHVKHHPYWSGLGSWQAIPDIDDIVVALEECYELGDRQRQQLRDTARRHALRYDTQRVLMEHFVPALRVAERRFAARRPVRIPSRLRRVA